ncbi:MAG: hypothetical protein FJ096_04490 [Deltaproteobacteria bacterium]|nr:hypothetical protein [Deltaproteobacteria bacterium]
MMIPRRSWLAAVVVAAATLVGCGPGTEPQPTPTGPSWAQLFSELPGALISVWGTDAKNVWAVGGDAGDGDGPMTMHFDGTRWTRHLTGKQGDLWWVHGFEGGPLFMGGTKGQILRYEGGAFEPMATPASAGTIFGIWGAAPDDVWAVGGAGSTPTGGFLWHYDGKTWSPSPLAPSTLAAEATVFKAWGTRADDVWFVGTGGLILHYDGKAIEKVESPIQETLFTVNGASGRVYAVGADGVILENAGAGWASAAPDNARQMNGVAALGDDAFAVGVYGGVMRREGGAWKAVDTGLSFQDDYHGVWLDPDGGAWCVGGQIAADPLVEGTLTYFGEADIPGSTFDTVK